MGGEDKLQAVLGGRPVLAWAVGTLASTPVVERIVIVTAAHRVTAVADAPWLPDKVATVVAGGDRRHESVAAGVDAIAALGAEDDRPVLVHDGARPAVSVGLVERVVDATLAHGAAIPLVPVPDTLKRVEGDRVVTTVDRTGLAAAQTPQGVRFGLLRQAFATFPPPGERAWTDEAALLEACSISVHALAGDPRNLKVTVPADLERIAPLLRTAAPRVGFGHDGHPFGVGSGLRLGGIELHSAPRLHGHSDGDVALHAVADALLGAAALGDLGRLFPADSRTPRGIGSDVLVAEVIRRLSAVGLRPASVDVTILAARPRLGTRLDAMRAAIAELLGIAGDRVSVKASTGNLDGMEGAGRGISARAVAVVEPVA